MAGALVGVTAVSLAPLMKVSRVFCIVAPAGAVRVLVPAAVLLVLVADRKTASVAAALMFGFVKLHLAQRQGQLIGYIVDQAQIIKRPQKWSLNF